LRLDGWGASQSEEVSSSDHSISKLERIRTTWGSDEFLGFLAFAAAYYWAYRYGRSFSHAAASPFWLPDSILLCALLLNRPGKWWLFVLAALPIRLFPTVLTESIPLSFLLGSYAVDSLSSVAAAWALRRVLHDPLRFDRLQTFGIFCLIAVGIAPGISAFGGAALRTAFGNNFWATWEQWFLGDALAQFVFTPAILCLFVKGRSDLQALGLRRRIEGMAVLSGLAIASYVAGNSGGNSVMLTEPRFYTPIFFLLWAAIRFGMFGASIAVPVWAFIFASAAAAGDGPFTRESADATAMALQSYLFPRSFTIYFVALSLEQLARARIFAPKRTALSRDG
jgi:integral membrane sensor domain MASE1